MLHRSGSRTIHAAACALSHCLMLSVFSTVSAALFLVPAEYVAAVYSEIRADEVASEVPHSYTTARTLLSILRLSQALARLRFANHVDQVNL